VEGGEVRDTCHPLLLTPSLLLIVGKQLVFRTVYVRHCVYQSFVAMHGCRFDADWSLKLNAVCTSSGQHCMDCLWGA